MNSLRLFENYIKVSLKLNIHIVIGKVAKVHIAKHDDVGREIHNY